MKVLLRIPILLLLLLTFNSKVQAQPANDDCAGAYEVVISDFEENVILTNGDTRGATVSTIPEQVCSTLWYTDDIFFKFRTPSVIPLEGLIIKAYFDKSQPTDVPAIGMALYESCDSIQSPLLCFNSNDPADNHFEISGFCLETNHTYFIRVWSTGADSTTEGTLRMGVYINRPKERILWWETFDGGIDVNGWTTYGTCAIADSMRGFEYLPQGIIDKGAYAIPGQAIHGASFCDGAVGVDSDFNDNNGDPNIFGYGPCPTPGQKFLISPVIYSGDWNVRGLTLTWIQALRQYQSEFFISFRYRNENDTWSNWTERQVNKEFIINSPLFEDNVQRYFLPGAAGHDSIQIQFIYNDNYYFWAIDDVKIIESECNDAKIIPGDFSLAPFVKIPADQIYPFAAMTNIFNAGACPMTGGLLNLTIQNLVTKEIVYNENLPYGTVGPDSPARNQIFPKLIDLPKYQADYRATYTLTHDSIDANPLDNLVSYFFSVGGDTFSLEDGFTRTVPLNTIFDMIYSYTYGNYFRPTKDAIVQYIIWGVNNPSEMTGKSVNVNLFQWTDTNGDQISQSNERTLIGYEHYTFSGNEGENALINSELVNVINPGDPVIMTAGLGYMAMIEYKGTSSTDPQLFLLVNDTRDYTLQQMAMDSAVALGLASDPIYFSVLGFSPDGNIDNIDYEVKELDVNDTRIFLGNDIIPLVRIVVSSPDTTNTNNILPLNNIIYIYPNPVSDEIHVNFEFIKPYKNVQLNLINNLGQIVFNKTLLLETTNHSEKINVSAFPPGNYLLQVLTPDGQRTLPIIIARP